MKKILDLQRAVMNAKEFFEIEDEKIENSKYNALEKRIEELFKEGESKIIVFANQLATGVTRPVENRNGWFLGKELQNNFSNQAHVEFIDSKDSVEERKNKINSCKKSEKSIMLMTGQLGGEGFDNSYANRVIIINPAWNMARIIQEASRVIDMEETGGSVYDILITRDTIEEGIYKLAKEKEKVIRKLMQGGRLDEIQKQLLRDDIDSLPQQLSDYYDNLKKNCLNEEKVMKI